MVGATRAFNLQRETRIRREKKNGCWNQKQHQVKMTLIGQNTYLIVNVSSPPILTQQQSKPAKLCHVESTEILPETCVPPSPRKSLRFEELEIKQEPLYNISAASPLTHTWAQQNRADMCPHSTAVPRAVAGPAPSASSFILQR